jgi:hypothetical protein
MATKVYDKTKIVLLDNTEVEISSLKIKYLHEFMEEFEKLGTPEEIDALDTLTNCVRVAMKQFYPQIKTVEDVEDSVNLKTMYKIIELCSGINIDPSKEDLEPEPLSSNSNAEPISWKELDLAKLESEVFVLGIWKNYEELEQNMSLPELMATIERTRELDYEEKKFMAAMQGVDLDEANGKQEEDPWEAMKARVAAKASGIDVVDSNDITSFQGIKAQQAGFGIGLGLDYGTSI